MSDLVVVHDPRRGVPRERPAQPHPGPHWELAVWGRSGLSPIELSLGSGPLFQYWIGAAGHAWSRLDLDSGASGERDVLLPRGGPLDIGVANLPVGYEASLRIHSAGNPSELLMEHRVRGSERLEFEGWPTGRCRVQLVIPHPEAVLAEEDVEVDSGARAEVTLRFPWLEGGVSDVEVMLLPPADDPTLAELGDETWLALRPLDPTPVQAARVPAELEIAFHQMSSSPAGARFRFWTFQEVPKGSYLAVLQPFGLTSPVEVVPGGPARLEMEIEGLARTRVRWLYDGAPGALSVARLSATLDSAYAAEPEWLEVHQSREPDDTYLLVSAPGKLRLQALESDLSSRERSIEVVAGWNEFEFVLGDTPRLTIELVADGLPVPVDLSFWFGVEVTPSGSTTSQVTRRLVKGEEDAVRAVNSRARFDFSGPGTFRFRFPGMPDFEELALLEREVCSDDGVWTIDLGHRRSARSSPQR